MCTVAKFKRLLNSTRSITLKFHLENKTDSAKIAKQCVWFTHANYNIFIKTFFLLYFLPMFLFYFNNVHVVHIIAVHLDKHNCIKYETMQCILYMSAKGRSRLRN